MKRLIFILIIALSFNLYAQDSTKVANNDLIEFRNTIEQLEVTNEMLWETQKGYEESIYLYNQEIGELRMAIKADSTIVGLHEEKFILQGEKVDIYKSELKKKETEIWIWKGVAVVIAALAIFAK